MCVVPAGVEDDEGLDAGGSEGTREGAVLLGWPVLLEKRPCTAATASHVGRALKKREDPAAAARAGPPGMPEADTLFLVACDGSAKRAALPCAPAATPWVVCWTGGVSRIVLALPIAVCGSAAAELATVWRCSRRRVAAALMDTVMRATWLSISCWITAAAAAAAFCTSARRA
jgi:hypothetical protein